MPSFRLTGVENLKGKVEKQIEIFNRHFITLDIG